MEHRSSSLPETAESQGASWATPQNVTASRSSPRFRPHVPCRSYTSPTSLPGHAHACGKSVTSVGATKGINPAVAASFTSGGFSNFFPRPSYQETAVQTYLNRSALGDGHSGRYNATGRAYPDVSVHGVDYLYNLGGKFSSAYGTSTSTPAFASIIALLNDRLLSAGKPPLGFLNPLLYSRGVAAFTDVTAGSNPGCGTEGFPADVGWDPVSRLTAHG